mgnify:FL=1
MLITSIAVADNKGLNKIFDVWVLRKSVKDKDQKLYIYQIIKPRGFLRTKIEHNYFDHVSTLLTKVFEIISKREEERRKTIKCKV